MPYITRIDAARQLKLNANDTAILAGSINILSGLTVAKTPSLPDDVLRFQDIASLSGATGITIDLSSYQKINSSGLSITPTVPNPPYNDSSYQIANTRFVHDSLTAVTINFTGTTLQYIRGDGSYNIFPTGLSQFINDTNFSTGNTSSIIFSTGFTGTGTSGSPITISTGLTSYIQAQNILSQAGANFWIGGNGRIDGNFSGNTGQITGVPSGNTDILRLIDLNNYGKNYKKEMYVVGVNEVVFPMLSAGTLYSITGQSTINIFQFKTSSGGTYASLPGTGTTYSANTDMYITFNYASSLYSSGWLRLIGKDN